MNLATVFSVAELERTIKARQGLICLQPVYDLETGDPVMHEVLLRMLDARGDEILPRGFLPTAVENDMLPQIDLLTLQLLEDQLRLTEHLPPTMVSLNLSRRTLAYAPYLEKLQQPAWKSLLPKLIFEVKTGDITRDAAAMKTLKTMKNAGTCLCVDYQQGGARMVELAIELGFDYLKIDAMSVTMRFNDKELKEVASACQKARDGGLKIIFERVETKKDLGAIEAYQPRYAQGYYFGLPQFSFTTRKLDKKPTYSHVCSQPRQGLLLHRYWRVHPVFFLNSKE